MTSARLGAALAPDEWLRIVGPKIAARTRVGRLQRGTLAVYAASSAWCNELSFLENDIVARLREAGWEVNELHVRIGSFEALPVAPQTGVVQRAPLPPELEARLALIEDPALRAAVADAAALSLSRTASSRATPARTAPPNASPAKSQRVAPTPSAPTSSGARGGRPRR